MAKRIVCICLALMLLLGMIPVSASAEEPGIGLRLLESGESYTDIFVSQNIIDMIKDVEGFSATPYWDHSQWTIGYGTACGYNWNDKPNLTVTREEAEKLLLNEVNEKYGRIVNEYCASIGRQPNQQQFDALVDFTYNLGGTWTRGCMLTDWLENPTTELDFVNAIGRWGRVSSKVSYATCMRRVREAIIFMKGEYYLTYGNGNFETELQVVSNHDLPYYKATIYLCEGGEIDGLPDDVSYHYAGASYSQFPIPEQEGYVFVGWQVTRERTSNLGEPYMIEPDMTVEENLHLSACWEKSSEETEPEATEPEETETETTEPEVTEPEESEPETTAPEATEPEETEPETTEPEVTEPVETEPEETEPTETEPSHDGIMGTVNTGVLRIRSGPGTDYDTLGYYTRGQRVEILEQHTIDNVVWGRTMDGWISLDYVILDERKEETEPTEPETEPTTEPETQPETEPPFPFEDVAEDSWYRECVEFVYESGYMKGISQTLFGPDDTMTRAMLVTVLYRMAGEPAVEADQYGQFEDVKESDYFAYAVAWAKENGIVLGVSDTSFAPSRKVSRQDAITIFHRYYVQYLGFDGDASATLGEYADYKEIASYALPSVAWAVENDIINVAVSEDGMFLNPRKDLTRAEAARLMFALDSMSADTE